MLFHFVVVIISLGLLLWAANHLVIGASGIAKSFNIPPLFIGLSIVAIGTTAPEIMVSVVAALHQKTDMAVGNAIGSNIANIGLVLGITALIQPLHTQSALLKREYPLLFIIMLLLYLLLFDGYLNLIDGVILLGGALILLIYIAWLSQKKQITDPYAKELEEMLSTQRSTLNNIIRIIMGIVILPLSANWLVNAAAAIASWFGISDLVIGLSLLAVGTSLPELATSVVAALKKEDDIAIGNILGSNMFNILLVLSFPGLIYPDKISDSFLWRDMPMMIFLTLMLLLFNYKKNKRITRWDGALLVFIYMTYLSYLAFSATVT